MIFKTSQKNHFQALLQDPQSDAQLFLKLARELEAGVTSGKRPHIRKENLYEARCVRALAGELDAESLICSFEADMEEERGSSNLGDAVWAQIGALILDALEGKLSDGQLQRMQHQQRLLANDLLRVGKGNPHVVTNNWWAVTHSGLVLACLCLPSDENRDRILDFATGRLRAFFHHFGPACLYHEGLGYQMYTLSNLLPALTALENQGWFSFSAEFPQVRNLAHSLLTASAAIPSLSNQPGEASRQGGMLSWNDAGHAWPPCNVAALSIPLAVDPAPLWTWYRKLIGLDNKDASLPINDGGLYCLAMQYPHPRPQALLSSLKTTVLDTRQGLLICRNHWQDADDLVVGVYARSTHVGGHSQDDAGSLRVIGMGYDWILGGGQNRPAARWQSVALPDTPEEKDPSRCGAVMFEQSRADGFTLGMELRKARGAYCERYVSFFSNPVSQVDGMICLLDQIDEHRDLPWAFQLTLSPQHQIIEHPTGITLQAPDQSCMHLHFFTPPISQNMELLPESCRTFAGGNQERYVSFPVLSAHFAARKPLAIYTLITFSKNGHIPLITADEGLTFGLDGNRFDQPFGSAVSSDFVCNRHAGLCQNPLYLFNDPV